MASYVRLFQLQPTQIGLSEKENDPLAELESSGIWVSGTMGSVGSKDVSRT